MTDWPRPTGDSEPEIIPPGAPHGRARVWVFEGGQAYGGRRLGAGRPGPLAPLLLGMALGAGLLITMIVLLGAVLLWLPLIGLIAVVALVAGILRGPSRRPY